MQKGIFMLETYIMKNVSKQNLLRGGFQYSQFLSDFADEVYTYKFPLLVYRKNIIVECEMAVSLLTGIVNVNVYAFGTRELYAPFYDREYGAYGTVKEMDAKIRYKMKCLGIEKKD